jgi:hypothetical protein
MLASAEEFKANTNLKFPETLAQLNTYTADVKTIHSNTWIIVESPLGIDTTEAPGVQ